MTEEQLEKSVQIAKALRARATVNLSDDRANLDLDAAIYIMLLTMQVREYEKDKE